MVHVAVEVLDEKKDFGPNLIKVPLKPYFKVPFGNRFLFAPPYLPPTRHTQLQYQQLLILFFKLSNEGYTYLFKIKIVLVMRKKIFSWRSVTVEGSRAGRIPQHTTRTYAHARGGRCARCLKVLSSEN